MGRATLTTVPSMMFMNIAATNTVLTTTFWLTARTGRANFTNYYKSMETSAVPAAAGAIRVTFRQADGWTAGQASRSRQRAGYGRPAAATVCYFRLRGPIVASRIRAM